MRLVRLLTLPALLALCFNFVANAQVKVAVTPDGPPKAMKYQEFCQDLFPLPAAAPLAVNPVNINLPVAFRAGSEYPIGTTLYDSQSNAALGSRMSRSSDGRLMGVWTMALEAGTADRGTGYNQYADGAWGDQPATRLESDRTGWPSHTVTESGTEVTIAHSSGSASDFRIITMRREAGSDTWVEGVVSSTIYPADGGPGLLWPRAAAGGEYVHIISVTAPTANGGGPYEGLDPHPLYYRSSDGGATWDMVDVILPGLDSTTITDMAADSYQITAKGETVAIAFFDSWQDLLVMKSTDGGATWEKLTVVDFPLDRYQVDQGYTLDDLPPYDPAAPDSLAIFTSDGTGSVLIDNDGKVHVFFGAMWVLDDDLTDGTTSFFPTTDGLMYWNESFGTDSLMAIAFAEDLNGNDTLDIDVDGVNNSYFFGLTALPTSSIDADGNIFVSYASIMEGDEFFNLEDNQHYRHIYGVASADGGETWLEPFDIINPDVVLEPDLINFMEAVFPCMAQNTAGTIDLIYQQDFRPGTFIRDGDPQEVNFINHISLTPEEFGLVSKTEEVVQPDYFQLEVQPNPATNEAVATFRLENNSQYSLSLLNIMGQKVADVETAKGFTSNQARVDVKGLTPGMYLLRLQAEGKVSVAKLMVK
ncbi:MAG: T9SS type A sorting domain-containing protein [Lewinellaceae bacterium]|nr:T9SS type A sorting domain-containing protein [Lewinellaceae bacterium]